MLQNLANLAPLVTEFVSLGTLVLLGIELIVILLLIFPKTRNVDQNAVLNFMSKNALLLSFLVALAAALGSLYFSEIADYPPCKLCWVQRIFIYPQVVLLGIAAYKKDLNIRLYSGVLAVLGVIVSIYHYIVQTYQIDIKCLVSSVEGACTTQYVLSYGFVTIPMMALSISLFILLSMIIAKKKSPENPQTNEVI